MSTFKSMLTEETMKCPRQVSGSVFCVGQWHPGRARRSGCFLQCVSSVPKCVFLGKESSVKPWRP